MARSVRARANSAARQGKEMNSVKVRMEHQPKNSMSRLQMEVAAKRKTIRRHGTDQKSRLLPFSAFCTRERCRVKDASSREGRQLIGEAGYGVPTKHKQSRREILHRADNNDSELGRAGQMYGRAFRLAAFFAKIVRQVAEGKLSNAKAAAAGLVTDGDAIEFDLAHVANAVRCSVAESEAGQVARAGGREESQVIEGCLAAMVCCSGKPFRRDIEILGDAFALGIHHAELVLSAVEVLFCRLAKQLQSDLRILGNTFAMEIHRAQCGLCFGVALRRS